MENSKYILENTKHWISNCDSKISYLLTINGVIITIIFSSENAKYLVETFNLGPASICSLNHIINFFEYVTLLAFIAFLLLSLYQGLKALKGQVNPKDFDEDYNKDEKSRIFWGDISQNSFNDYHNSVESFSENDFKKDLRKQVYINSKICSLKFKLYNKMLSQTAYAYICLILYVIIKIKNIS